MACMRLVVACLLSVVAIATAATPRYVVVGGTNTNFNYPWNPAVNLAYWAQNARVYIGDYIGTLIGYGHVTQGLDYPFVVLFFLSLVCIYTFPVVWLLHYAYYPCFFHAVFQYPTHTDEIYLFNSLNDLRACNYANAVRVCRDWSGEGNGCNVQAKQQGVLYIGSGVYSRCMKNMRVRTEMMNWSKI